MSYHFKIFPVQIIIFIIISFQCSHFSTLNAEEYLNIGQGPNEVYFMESSSSSSKYIDKVSGEDKNEVKERVFLEKFRFLLGLRSLQNGKSRHEFGSFSPSPSPAPSIVKAPTTPRPLPWIHRHTHPSKQHHHLIPAANKVEEKDRGKAAKFIAASVVSVAVVFLLCFAGIFMAFQRFRKQRKKSDSSAISVLTGNSKYAESSLNSDKKISSDPGPDLFHNDSTGVGLEHQETAEIVRSKNQDEGEDLIAAEAIENQESKKYGTRSFGEIVCVHETAKQPKNHHIISVDEITLQKMHTSEIDGDVDDDETFHSCNDSAPAKVRLSNASAGSYYSNNSKILSQKKPFKEFDSVSIQVTNQESHLQSGIPSIPQPPPPPPSTLSTQSSSRYISRRTVYKTFDSSSKNASNHTTQSSSPSSVPNPPMPSGGGGCSILPPPLPFGRPYNAKGALPPPPPQLSQHTAFGRDGSPLMKLKPLHWDKVRAASVRSTVWDKMRSSSFEFDEETIKSLFGCNLQNTGKNDELKNKTPYRKKHVLELKRLQNITILTKALNMTSEQVCDALIKGNGLALQELEALAKMVPTKEEETKFSNYKGNVDELGTADQFIRTMVKIPFAFSRIEAMLYRETFDDEVIYLRKSFSMLEEACKELISSRLFLKLLEAVLKTGNRMNIGTVRGGAQAFKLDALLKLSDVKATDGKTTLLHFVVQEIVRSEGFRVSESIMGKINQKTNKKSGNIEDKEAEYKKMGLELVSGLGTELCNVKKTATLDLDVLATSVSNLSQGMMKLHRLVYKDMSVEEKNGNFVHAFRTFLTYAERSLKEVQEDENRVLLRVKEITEYFHGNVSKEESNRLRIFVIVRDFLCMLDHVCKELRSLKIPATSNPLAPFQ